MLQVCHRIWNLVLLVTEQSVVAVVRGRETKCRPRHFLMFVNVTLGLNVTSTSVMADSGPGELQEWSKVNLCCRAHHHLPASPLHPVISCNFCVTLTLIPADLLLPSLSLFLSHALSRSASFKCNTHGNTPGVGESVLSIIITGGSPETKTEKAIPCILAQLDIFGGKNKLCEK